MPMIFLIYVQGNELNDSLQAINLYTCFIGAGISRAGLLNEKAYRVLTSEDLCINRYSPILSQQKAKAMLQKVQVPSKKIPI